MEYFGYLISCILFIISMMLTSLLIINININTTSFLDLTKPIKCPICSKKFDYQDILLHRLLFDYARIFCKCNFFNLTSLIIIQFLLLISCFYYLPNNNIKDYFLWFFCWQSITLAACDYKLMAVPEFLLIILLLTGFIANYMNLFCPFDYAIYGSIASSFMLFFINFIYKKYRGHDGLGDGDIILAAAIGAWVGIYKVFSIILDASIIAIIILLIRYFYYKISIKNAIAFMPMLLISTFFYLQFGKFIWQF